MTGSGTLNIEPLRRSRKKPCEGDIFAIFYASRFIFGRVIVADTLDAGPMPKCSVVYIYKIVMDSKSVGSTLLTPNELLIPPQVVHHSMWSRGYFETVSHEELDPDMLLSRTCFKHLAMGRYVDETGQAIDKPVEPCGIWAMNSVGSLDEKIGDALGVPTCHEE